MTAPIAPPVYHTPSKPTDRGVATTGSQRSRRFTDTMWDNHRHPVRFPNGRPFTGEREFTSGSETESITAGFITSDLQQGAYYCENPQMGQTPQERHQTLTSTWSAPWIPLAKYFRFNYRSKRITFAYDKMIADENEGLVRYWDAAAKLAGENDIIDPERPLAVPFRIRTLLGVPTSYTGKIKLAQACQAGDPWLLGFVDEPNVELAKILGLKVNFIGGRAGDAEHTLHAIPAAQAPPVVTPEQVLATPPADIAKMIAEATAIAVKAALEERDRVDAEKKRKQGEQLAAARAKKTKPATAGAE